MSTFGCGVKQTIFKEIQNIVCKMAYILSSLLLNFANFFITLEFVVDYTLPEYVHIFGQETNVRFIKGE